MATPASEPQFRYMPGARVLARWIDAPCACGAAGPNLDGAYFEGEGVLRAVCLRCLAAGKIERDLAGLRDELRARLKARNPAWGAARVTRTADERAAELARTPPVPWLGKNEWPICCDDFAVYRGEWAKREWERAAKDGDGQAALARVLGDADRAATVYKDLAPDAGGAAGPGGRPDARVATFVFFCPTCKKLTVIVQER
jgi:uncharacterized protein CbrC (UPF0167 family)